jgi:hypothetical protein
MNSTSMHRMLIFVRAKYGRFSMPSIYLLICIGDNNMVYVQTTRTITLDSIVLNVSN